MDKNSLAHTQWECKYHIVFAPKFRRKVVYGKIEGRYRWPRNQSEVKTLTWKQFDWLMSGLDI